MPFAVHVAVFGNDDDDDDGDGDADSSPFFYSFSIARALRRASSPADRITLGRAVNRYRTIAKFPGAKTKKEETKQKPGLGFDQSCARHRSRDDGHVAGPRDGARTLGP